MRHGKAPKQVSESQLRVKPQNQWLEDFPEHHKRHAGGIQHWAKNVHTKHASCVVPLALVLIPLPPQRPVPAA